MNGWNENSCKTISISVKSFKGNKRKEIKLETKTLSPKYIEKEVGDLFSKELQNNLSIIRKDDFVVNILKLLSKI